MSRRYDCSDPMERTRGIAEAVSAVRRGELVVLPTDTVYGIGADAFTPAAVNALLEAKGRGRDMPSPVLVGSVRAAQALVEDFGTYGQDLVDEFWPGALTLVCRANSTLAWDLGDSKGTVAIRMPLHQLTLELLKETGPLAVSSANRSGAAPARTAKDAETQLGESVEVYLDDGTSGEADPSSIVDLTGAVPRLLRAGAISEDRIREVCGVLLSDEDEPTEHAEEPAEPAEAAKSEEPAEAAKSEEPADTAEPVEIAQAEAAEPAAPAEPAGPVETTEATSGTDAPATSAEERPRQ
ncbi:L-threonylcarbamoyladenylate synthase [Actinoallomurus bryophytorum]|uniref:L-threonylcarbamoyladenylate synthase n=1 Tax=Actinoallomurus bryophytorum TaxID=1490222 RepID=UPI001151EC69|nr:L-threonylcarbamoyladenylate synthase [Actinoallomurus bryophytorum]